MKKLLPFFSMILFLVSCMSVKPFPELMQGDFHISELDSSKNLVRCTSEHASIRMVENRTGSKMDFNYSSPSINIDLPDARWVGGAAFEGVSTKDGKNYTVTMGHHKKPYIVAIEVSPAKFILVGLKCWGEQSEVTMK